MQPRVHYAVTRDGIEIAYGEAGHGIPLVTPPPASPWSDFAQEWDIPEWRHWHEHLADFCRVVRYDGRGAGGSQRAVREISLDTELADLEAVVDALGLDRFALFGVYHASLVCIAYAARHPERVSHLVLWCGLARAHDAEGSRLSPAMTALLDESYEMFTETVAHQVFGWNEGDPAHRLAQYMHTSAAPEIVKAAWLRDNTDVSGDLERLRMPVLMLHRRQFPGVPARYAREMAARMPDARLVFLDGASLSPYLGDMETPIQEIARFLGTDEHHDHAQHYRPGPTAGFRVIMFTDIEGSTATTQMVGDARAHEMLRTHNAIVRRALHAFDGTEVKHTGDGIMASFTSAVTALECAMAIQRRLAAQSMMEQEQHPPFAVRIGINAGEPVVEGGDLFGTSVQIASRICTAAEPRQILVSDLVRQLVAGKGFLFSGRGETELRGLEEPVRLFEVRWHEGD